MLPALAALIALQEIDTAVDTAHRQIAELPERESALQEAVAAAEATRREAADRLARNRDASRELEKQVAGVDSRLARFDEHKAAVKTNQEYTALLHEIDTARAEKNGLEDQMLEMLEEADGIQADVAAAERAVADAMAAAKEGRVTIDRERRSLEGELQTLGTARETQADQIDADVLARYEQLRRQRKGIAVALMENEVCTACYVRQRPHAAQQVRRNDAIVACESCQRILHAPPAAPVEGHASA